jgi:hypothetical protein
MRWANSCKVRFLPCQLPLKEGGISGPVGSWKLELQGSVSDLLPFKLMFYNNSNNNYWCLLLRWKTRIKFPARVRPCFCFMSSSQLAICIWSCTLDSTGHLYQYSAKMNMIITDKPWCRSEGLMMMMMMMMMMMVRFLCMRFILKNFH